MLDFHSYPTPQSPLYKRLPIALLSCTTEHIYINDDNGSISEVLFSFLDSWQFPASTAHTQPASVPDPLPTWSHVIPCAEAAQDPNASVSSSCCAQVKRIGQNPKCLCAVMLSDVAKSSGVKPEIALTIPKRCNFADRPVGYKCDLTRCLEVEREEFDKKIAIHACCNLQE
ncbi:UNVERIFIED_CONTAM: hypothetical protein Sradi_4651600 [Sesamum radiatum]|uniref:Bifunctional inhibitor/plant lipid transfer protein/seed storage helical domain-containing protein n=1 Tax=Sesamum radiatum TaxID=300843 RepID=A0AAW2NEF4_SESRA